jgi:DNA-binding transcriptional LysR family regulator
MELRHLRYFVAVAEERSFTRGAERLWITQPGLSQQILTLERELGVKLFERRGRGVELTDAGTVFLEHARVALDAADTAMTSAKDATEGLRGTLRLGLSWRARYGVAPELQHLFGVRRPLVDVRILEAQTDTLLSELRHDGLDAAIVLGDHRTRLSGVQWLTLSSTPVGVLMAADHPLAKRPKLGRRHLRGHTFMISGDEGSKSVDDQARSMLASLGVGDRVLAGGYGLSQVEPVRAGKALMLDATPPMPCGSDICWRPVEPAPVFELDLVWLQTKSLGPLRAFVELCREYVPCEPTAPVSDLAERRRVAAA